MDKASNTLQQKILFTIFIIIVYRIGSYIPVAGLDANILEKFTAQNQVGILGMLNTISGGSLGRMSIFALAVMPYITSSIVMQLLSSIFKPLENLKKEGDSGRKQFNQLIKYLTIGLAFFQAYGMAVMLEMMPSTYGEVVRNPGIFFRLTTSMTLSVGTLLLMWMGEQVTLYGIGNGVSLIIFSGIVAGLPSAIISSFELTRIGVISGGVLLIVMVLIFALVGIIVIFERASRKILVYYPKRQVGNKMYGGENSYIPLKINTSGVIPPIFASSLLLFPLTVLNVTNVKWLEGAAISLNRGSALYITLYVVLIIFFSFFYTAVVFNSEETANNLKKYGAYVPGRRPGKHTAEYFDYVLSRVNIIGAIYLAGVCALPEYFMSKYAIGFTLSGQSFLIVINVIIETFTQIQTHLFSAKYEKLAKKMKLVGSK